MGVQSSWYDTEQTVIVYTFQGQWTWEDYNNALTHTRTLLDTVTYPVDLIYDFSQAPIPPKNLVTRFWQVSMTRHHNISGLIIALGNSTLMRMLINTIGGLICKSSSYYHVSSVQCLTQVDEHLVAKRAIHRAQNA